MVAIIPPPSMHSFYATDPVTPTDYYIQLPHNATGAQQMSQMPLVPIPYQHGSIVPAAYSLPLGMVSQRVPPVGNIYSVSKQQHMHQHQQQAPMNCYSWPSNHRKVTQDSGAFQGFNWNLIPGKVANDQAQDSWSKMSMKRQSSKVSAGGLVQFDYGSNLAPSDLDFNQLNIYDHQNDICQQPKAGGVAANLDYNIDRMADFLSSMTSILMGFKTPPTQAFRKFTVQILSSTRLPGSTIMLALVYMSRRCEYQMASANVEVIGLYQLLIVALLLANKFNDDHTFTNKSWADVTGLPITELTRIETNWLVLIDWKLNPDKKDIGLWSQWNDCWISWNNGTRYYSSSQQFSHQISPIDRTVNRTTQDSRHMSFGRQFRYSDSSNGVNVTHMDCQQQQQQQQQRLQVYYPFSQLRHTQHTSQSMHHQGRMQSSSNIMSSYSMHCNCTYCSFEPGASVYSGPAAVC
ncbi:hypothetical protein V1511DRAFT_461943 [Dipodascopsis uninucleata]